MASIVFNLQTLLAVVTFALISAWYLWPRLKVMAFSAALVPLLLFSAFRFLGSAFLVPNWSAGLSADFTRFAAYGDTAVGIVALLAALLVRKHFSSGIALAWLYAIAGSLDFVYNATRLNKLAVAEHIGPLWPLMTLLGAAWMVTLVLLWLLLFKGARKAIVSTSELGESIAPNPGQQLRARSGSSCQQSRHKRKAARIPHGGSK